MTRTSLDAHGLKIDLVLVTEQVGSLPVAGQCSECPQGSSAFWLLVLPAHCDPKGHFAMGGTTHPHACGCPAWGCERVRGSQSPSSALYHSGVPAGGVKRQDDWCSCEIALDVTLPPTPRMEIPVDGDPCL